MSSSRAVLKVLAGPNKGDSIGLESGACRLVGRHLSENETSFMSPEGHRMLDAAASKILSQHLRDRSPVAKRPKEVVRPADFQPNAFVRATDVIFADDAISRAHAMIFYDASGVGIVDLASTNGTYLNGQRISGALLSRGDVVALGDSELEITFDTSG